MQQVHIPSVRQWKPIASDGSIATTGISRTVLQKYEGAAAGSGAQGWAS